MSDITLKTHNINLSPTPYGLEFKFTQDDVSEKINVLGYEIERPVYDTIAFQNIALINFNGIGLYLEMKKLGSVYLQKSVIDLLESLCRDIKIEGILK